MMADRAAGEGPLQPALEQPGGAGPSESEATNPAHAGIQAIRQRGGNDFWDRVGGDDQEKTIQDGQAGRPKGDDAGVVERGTRCLSPSQFTQPTGAQPNSLSA